MTQAAVSTAPWPSRATAASRAREILGIFGQSKHGVLDQFGGDIEREIHYPPGEARDERTQAHFFYHAHAAGHRPDPEHGHFHTFIGQQAMPPHIHPFVFPEITLAPLPTPHGGVRDAGSEPSFPGVFTHLIGIAIDSRGIPISLFTTNRWVTGETWFAGEHVAAMLPLFRFEDGEPPEGGKTGIRPDSMRLIGEWLANILHALQPIIVDLLVERDRRIADWRRRKGGQIHVLNDRRLEVVTERRIDFAAELDAAIHGRY